MMDEILISQVILYADVVGDNACPHQGRIVNEFLENQVTEWIDWPFNSPEMNP